MLRNLNEDIFFLENTMSLGLKLRNLGKIFFKNERFLFFWSSSQNLRQFFCHIGKVLKNHDSAKCHKIWAKLYCTSFKFFWTDTAMLIVILCVFN